MSDLDLSTQGGKQGNANLVYILYLVNFIIPFTGIVGVVMAYLGKDEADAVTKSHYINQIHIFWKGMLYSFIAVILCFIVIGIILLPLVLVWFVVRIIKGMNSLGKGEVYTQASSWLF